MISIDAIDLQLNFLEGNPIDLDSGLIMHKVSFSEINKHKIGYYTYNKIINLLCMSNEDVKKYTPINDINTYALIIFNAIQSKADKVKNENEDSNDSYFFDELITVLAMIFQENVVLDEDLLLFQIGEIGTLNEYNFEQFQSILKKRNCLETIEEDIDNPANEMARQILEKRRKAREKLAKLKNDEEDNTSLTIADLISIFSEAERLSLSEVFKYDIYQFNDQFNRMKIFRDYNINIQAILAGAKSDEIEIKHWLSKIK